MDIRIIASGSSGNCVLINNTILIDAGITTKAFKAENIDMTKLKWFAVTHKHADHMKLPLVRYLLEAGIKAYLPTDVIAMLTQEGKVDIVALTTNRKIVAIDTQPLQIEDMTVTSYPQKHHDIVNYAFVIEQNDKRLLYSTDLDTVDATDIGVGLRTLGMFDIIMLEGNYDESFLRKYIEYTVSLMPMHSDPSVLSDDELEQAIRTNYRHLPQDVARNGFRAIQNRRHLSKQQARAYTASHLKEGGVYYELHRSSQFYEEPVDWCYEEQ